MGNGSVKTLRSNKDIGHLILRFPLPLCEIYSKATKNIIRDNVLLKFLIILSNITQRFAAFGYVTQNAIPLERSIVGKQSDLTTGCLYLRQINTNLPKMYRKVLLFVLFCIRYAILILNYFKNNTLVKNITYT